jgi:archaellin
LQSALGQKTGETFTIRTTFGIPVFIPPAAGVKKVDVSDVTVAGGRVRVTFTNSGSVHTSVSDVRITGTDAAGRTIFSNLQHGWYVLAENDRLFEAKLDHNECAKLANLTATVYSDAGTVAKSVAVRGTCK